MSAEANLQRLQDLDRIDPALRAAAAELDILEFSSKAVHEERARAAETSAKHAARVDTAGVVIESRTICHRVYQRLGVRIYRGTTVPGAPLG